MEKNGKKPREWIALLSVQLPFWILNLCEHIYNHHLLKIIISSLSYVYKREELKLIFSHLPFHIT
jgi:hypothetical protein